MKPALWTKISEAKTTSGALLFLSRFEVRAGSNGKNFVALDFIDGDGNPCSGKIWDVKAGWTPPLEPGTCWPGPCVVAGRIKEYKGTRYIDVSKIAPGPPDAVFERSYPPSMIDSRAERLRGRLTSVISADLHRRPSLQSLLDATLDVTTRNPDFRRSPAGTALHHNRAGGLVLHTFNVLDFVLDAASRYPAIQFDEPLLALGAVLHDIGKIHEYAHTPGFPKTKAAYLFGHIVMGNDMFAKIVRDVRPDAEFAGALRHIIVSHHGKKEWGSPEEPRTPEAFLVHYADLFDSSVGLLEVAMESRPDDRGWRKGPLFRVLAP